MLAVIPARGGSKGVPGKNLAEVGGRPLIVRAVATAAQVADVVVVSTDSADIAAAAAGAGAVIHDRPRHLAGDEVTSEAVLLDVLDVVDDPDRYFLFTQATSPFLRALHLLALIAAMADGATSAFLAVRWHHRILGDYGGTLRGINLDTSGAPPPRHRRPTQWYEAGAAYAVDKVGLLATGARLSGRIVAVEADPWAMLDIDTPEDLAACQALAPLLDRSHHP